MKPMRSIALVSDVGSNKLLTAERLMRSIVVTQRMRNYH